MEARVISHAMTTITILVKPATMATENTHGLYHGSKGWNMKDLML
jgi:hypothetical protein